MHIHSIWRCSNTFHTSNMNVWSSQWWSIAPTMSSSHHFIVATVTPNYLTVPTLPAELCKGATMCLSTAHEGAQKHSLHPIWMWKEVCGCLQPQQCHHAIISLPHWPQSTKIWANFASVTVWGGCTHMSINNKWCCSNTFHTSNMDVWSSQW